MHCGAYRALLELKMLWPYAIGTSENPRGVLNSKCYPPCYWGGPKQFPNTFE